MVHHEKPREPARRTGARGGRARNHGAAEGGNFFTFFFILPRTISQLFLCGDFKIVCIMENQQDVTFHDNFPKVMSCKSVAEPFFECLNTNTKKTDPLDAEAGARGLKACLKQKKAYDMCMDKCGPPKQFRVRHLLT